MSYTCIIFFSMILQHSSWDSSVSSLLEILSCSNLVLSKSESKFSLKCSTSCGSNNIKKNIKRPQLAHPRHETRHRWCAVGSGYKVTISIPCSNVTRTWSCIDRRFSSSSFSFSILLQLACVASYSLVVQLFKGNFQETKVPYNATYHAPGQKTTLAFSIYIYMCVETARLSVSPKGLYRNTSAHDSNRWSAPFSKFAEKKRREKSPSIHHNSVNRPKDSGKGKLMHTPWGTAVCII